MGGLELVIFDCDGVLVDTEPISGRVLAARLGAEGLTSTPQGARRDYQGLRMDEVIKRAEEKLGRRLPDQWLAGFVQERAEAFRTELGAVPGAAEAVARITRAGLGVCVASQAGIAKMRLTLGLTGLDRLFAPDALFSADLVARGKPFPDLFLHAAASMGAAPAACVVVEDSPSGVTAALRAGMRVLAYGSDPDGPSPFLAGAEPLGALSELPGLLGLD